MVQVAEYYRYKQEEIEEKFRNLTTDTMEEIRNKLKRKLNQEDQ